MYVICCLRVKPLHIRLPKASTYVKRYDSETNSMYFLFEDDDLLKRYNDIWNKASSSMKKELDCEPCTINIFYKPK